MEARDSRGRVKQMVGWVFLVVGSAALLAQAGVSAWHLRAMLNDSLGAIAGVGVDSMHALQSLAFDPSAPGSIARWLLISCSSLAMVMIGFALLNEARKCRRGGR
jgi:hypothetical protein